MGLLIGGHEALIEAGKKETDKKEEGLPDSLVWIIWPLSMPFVLAFALAYYPFIYTKKVFPKIKEAIKNKVAW